MANNWIILDTNTTAGIPVNLDYVVRVVYGGTFSTPKPLNLYVFHGVPNGGDASGGTSFATFSSANLALAAYNRLVQALIVLGYVGKDLRSPDAKITSLDNPTPVGGTDTLITVTGDNFNANGKITINGIDAPIFNFIDAQHISFQTGGGYATGGPYNVEYTQPDGVAAVLVNGIAFS